MVGDILCIILCLWVAARIRRRSDGPGRGPSSWELAKRSLGWGVLVATVPALAYLGVARFARGAGVPSVFSAIVCVGLTAVVLLGARTEVTGNVVADSLLVSCAVVAGCWAVANGLAEAWARLNGGALSTWLLACVGAAILVRAMVWLREGR